MIVPMELPRTQWTNQTSCINCVIVEAQCNLLKSENQLLWAKIEALSKLVECSFETNDVLRQSIIISEKTSECSSTKAAREQSSWSDEVVEDGVIYDHSHTDPELEEHCSNQDIINHNNQEQTEYDNDQDDNVDPLKSIYINYSDSTTEVEYSDSLLEVEISSNSDYDLTSVSDTSTQCMSCHTINSIASDNNTDTVNNICLDWKGSPKHYEGLPLTKMDDAPFCYFDILQLDHDTVYTHNFQNRQTAYYGESQYCYGGITHKSKSFEENPYLNKISSYLEVLLPNYKFNSALITKYIDGEAHIPPHGDTETEIVEGSDIVTVSLGDTRTMIFTNKAGEYVWSEKLQHGEIMLMSKESQYTFLHQIPKEQCRRTRISITYRLINPASSMPDSVNEAQEHTCSKPVTAPHPTDHSGSWDKRSSNSYGYDDNSLGYNDSHGYEHNTNHWKGESETLYISSSMFAELRSKGLSSDSQNAKILFYRGAQAHDMLRRLNRDPEFHAIDPRKVKQIFLLIGTNNVENICVGRNNLASASSDIVDMINFLLDHFAWAKLNIMNILPRVSKVRNDVINAINEDIAVICDNNHRLTFLDTESEFCLFSDKQNQRKSSFFRPPRAANEHDDVHLNNDGVARLARYLKKIAHKPKLYNYIDCEEY